MKNGISKTKKEGSAEVGGAVVSDMTEEIKIEAGTKIFEEIYSGRIASESAYMSSVTLINMTSDHIRKNNQDLFSSPSLFIEKIADQTVRGIIRDQVLDILHNNGGTVSGDDLRKCAADAVEAVMNDEKPYPDGIGTVFTELIAENPEDYVQKEIMDVIDVSMENVLRSRIGKIVTDVFEEKCMTYGTDFDEKTKEDIASDVMNTLIIVSGTLIPDCLAQIYDNHIDSLAPEIADAAGEKMTAEFLRAVEENIPETVLRDSFRKAGAVILKEVENDPLSALRGYFVRGDDEKDDDPENETSFSDDEDDNDPENETSFSDDEEDNDPEKETSFSDDKDDDDPEKETSSSDDEDDDDPENDTEFCDDDDDDPENEERSQSGSVKKKRSAEKKSGKGEKSEGDKSGRNSLSHHNENIKRIPEDFDFLEDDPDALEDDNLREIRLRCKSIVLKQNSRKVVHFDDIIGQEKAKEEGRLIVSMFGNPDIDPRWTPKNVLFYGPPGTGKTLLAGAISAESETNFIVLNSTDFLTRYVGESSKLISEMYSIAERLKPCILYFEEFDAIALNRSLVPNLSPIETVNTLLTEMDSLCEKTGICTICSTNNPEMIDPAILSRFRTMIGFTMPTKEETAGILRNSLKDSPVPIDPSFDLDLYSEKIYECGLSGRDIVFRITVKVVQSALAGNCSMLTADNFNEKLDACIESKKRTHFPEDNVPENKVPVDEWFLNTYV
ncbi:AAA family ATPase [Methanosarcinaceae archaeon]|nr:AAA family ATPase [Methanosarcinaceae archaeon]